MVKPRITQTTPYDSPGKDFGEIPTGSRPVEAPNRRGVGSNGDFRPMSRYISETVQDGEVTTDSE